MFYFLKAVKKKKTFLLMNKDPIESLVEPRLIVKKKQIS